MESNNDKKKEYGQLTLTLRMGDSITLGDSLITVTQLKNKVMRLTFNAPKNVAINRTNRVDTKKK